MTFEFSKLYINHSLILSYKQLPQTEIPHQVE